MRTVYMHIGTPKTGSTAIQGFCADNREVLEKKGYSYPDFPVKYGYVSKKHNGYFLRVEDMDQKESAFWDCMDVIRTSFQTCSNVVLSDEGTWRASRKWHEKFFEIMQKEGYLVKVVVYLRKQDEYLISRWNQFVKRQYFVHKSRQTMEEELEEGGGTWEAFLERGKKDPTMDYYKNLKKLEAVYGEENILVRRYDRNSFPGRSICADFLQTLGLELTEEYQDAEAVKNIGLSPNTAEIQRLLNTTPGGDLEENFRFFNGILLSFSEVSGKSYPCSMFSEEESREFMAKYQEGNHKVAKKYFGEEELFPSAGEAKPKWEKNNPCMQDDLIRFVGAACMQILEENRKMRQELQMLKEWKDKMRHPVHTIGKKLLAKQR